MDAMDSGPCRTGSGRLQLRHADLEAFAGGHGGHHGLTRDIRASSSWCPHPRQRQPPEQRPILRRRFAGSGLGVQGMVGSPEQERLLLTEQVDRAFHSHGWAGREYYVGMGGQQKRKRKG
jgi:hypothetical protein